jgi:hypothetical protein
MAPYNLRRSRAKAGLASLLALAALLLAGPVRAGDDPPVDAGHHGDRDDGGWSVSFVPYLWLTEVHGSIGLGDLSVPIDVGFDQVFDLMGAGDLLGGMGYLEVRRRRLIFFADAVGSVVRVDQKLSLGKAALAADFATLELGLGYRIYEGFDAISVDALVGGRYNYVYNSVAVEPASEGEGPQRRARVEFVDPFVGGRWAIRLGRALSLLFRGDIGGFGAGSQLAWSLLGGFRYETPWTVGPARLDAFAVYKVYDFDYEAGSGSARRAIAEEFRGPALGLGAVF